MQECNCGHTYLFYFLLIKNKFLWQKFQICSSCLIQVGKWCNKSGFLGKKITWWRSFLFFFKFVACLIWHWSSSAQANSWHSSGMSSQSRPFVSVHLISLGKKKDLLLRCPTWDWPSWSVKEYVVFAGINSALSEIWKKKNTHESGLGHSHPPRSVQVVFHLPVT